MSTEPLYVPRGSVRAIITLLTLGVFIVTTVLNKEPDLIISLILALILVMYFASRHVECKKRPPEDKLAEDVKISFNN